MLRFFIENPWISKRQTCYFTPTIISVIFNTEKVYLATNPMITFQLFHSKIWYMASIYIENYLFLRWDDGQFRNYKHMIYKVCIYYKMWRNIFYWQFVSSRFYRFSLIYSKILFTFSKGLNLFYLIILFKTRDTIQYHTIYILWIEGSNWNREKE